MDTPKFKTAIQQRFSEITKGINTLFKVDVDKDVLWEKYLSSFPEGTNPIYKERRVYDCNTCKQFVRRIGDVVSIQNGQVLTVWDVIVDSEVYQPVADSMNEFILSLPIKSVFVTDEKTAGATVNYGQDDNGKVVEYSHLHLELEKKFVNTSSKSNAEIRGEFSSSKSVFKRSLEELSEESLLTVLELIQSNTLYKGAEWKDVLNIFLKFKQAYDQISSDKEKDLFAWENSVNAGPAISRIRNHSIGTLLVDISEGMELEKAVVRYEKITAPSNYKRPQEIFSKKMLADAQVKVQELGLENSLGRCFATLDDIRVNNILFANKDAAKRVQNALDVFGELEKSIPNDPKKFSRVEEISIEDFLNNVLPSAHSIEAFVENKHDKNFVSLIAPQNSDAKTLFKWDNTFSWAYSGNITDSSMKENVKKAGGNVDGVLRFSLQWNDNSTDLNDLDAHCVEPRGNHIYYGEKHNYRTSGVLDVDIINPTPGKAAVENITWSNIDKMEEGEYLFFVKNFSDNGGRSGFRAEIEFEGQIFSFDYPRSLRSKEEVKVAKVKFSRLNGFTIEPLLDHSSSSKEVWNIQTNQFVPVSVVMFSPNYWDEQSGIGHKHFFFMLKDCVNPEKPNGFYNEFLKQDLLEHKRVFAALGSKLAVQDVEDQLSGIGFSSTKRNDLVVKVLGQTERVMKIKF